MTAYNKTQQKALNLLRDSIRKAQTRLKHPHRIHIDFETRCELNIKKVGAYKYSAHPSCEVLMMSYNLTGDPKDTKLWVMGQKPPQVVFAMIQTGALINAFNSYFEYCIWKNVCVPKMGWPDREIKDFVDTGDKCKALALPANLEEAAEVLKVEDLKDKEGKRLIKLFCEPISKGENKGQFNRPEDHPEDWKAFCRYCVRDTNAMIAIDRILPDLSPMEQCVAWLTDEMNWRGLYVDMTAVRAAQQLADEVKEIYNGEASKLSGGAFEKCTQRAKVKEWLKAKGMVLPDMQGKTIDVTLRRDDLKPEVRRMLELYKITGSTSVAKFTAMEGYVAEDGRIHELLNYHKARTGRWGGKGIQIQNFPRPVLPKCADYEEALRVIKTRDVKALEAYAKRLEKEDKTTALKKGKDKWWKANPMQVLVSCLRAVLCSMFDHHFKCADYSSIEARVLLWLAGDKRALDIFRRGEDIYLDMAAEIYGVPLKNLNKESDERPLGKEAILGCGYQMGHAKFRQRCDEVAGIKIDLQMAKHTIDTYRKKYATVKKLWNKLEEKAIQAITHPGMTTQYLGIKFMMTRYGKMPILLCRFPSGHTTGYPYAHVKMTEKFGREVPEMRYEGYDSYTNKWTRLNTYGGKLTENVTQGVARDLMALGMLLIDAMDYFLIMAVHDEAVSEDDEDFGSLEEFEMLLCTLPAWAGDLPVTSEGWVGSRYRK